MTKTMACGLLLLISLPGLTLAEPMALRCVYTEVQFSAPYMSQPETRACPENRCFYELRFDTAGNLGSVNAVEGYELTVDEGFFQLQRQVKNVIVSGTDSGSFRVNSADLSYRSHKTTPPGVMLETTGQCQSID